MCRMPENRRFSTRNPTDGTRSVPVALKNSQHPCQNAINRSRLNFDFRWSQHIGRSVGTGPLRQLTMLSFPAMMHEFPSRRSLTRDVARQSDATGVTISGNFNLRTFGFEKDRSDSKQSLENRSAVAMNFPDSGPDLGRCRYRSAL